MPKYLPPLQSEHLFTLLQRVAEIYPICDDALSGSALHRKYQVKICEEKPYPVWFQVSTRATAVHCEHSLLLGVASQNFRH